MRPSWPVGTCARRPAWRWAGPAVLASVVTTTSPAHGTTHRVPSDFPTIHEALAVAVAEDTVLVAPGTWTATTTRSINSPSGPVTYTAAGFLSYGVTLISESGATTTSIVVSATGTNVRCLVTDPAAGAGPARVIGFTFRKPNATGAAIVMHGISTSHLVVEDCRFVNLAGATEAGGIHATAGNLTVTGTLFSSCSSTTRAAGIAHLGVPASGGTLVLDLEECEFVTCTGGGVLTQQAELRASGCVFRGGTTGSDACGVSGQALRLEMDNCQFLDGVAPAAAMIAWSRVGSGGWIRGCLFARNTTGGGAVFLQSFVGDVSGNTFVANAGGSGAGTAALALSGGQLTVQRNVFAYHTIAPAVRDLGAAVTEGCNIYWNNTAGDVSGFTRHATSRVMDPQFCDAAGDYSVHSTSPCLPDGSVGCGAIGAFGVGCGPFPYIILTNPVGLNVRVDSILVPTPYAAHWSPGEQHVLQVVTPYDNGPTRAWTFSTWSDGSADTTRTITVPASPTVWQVDYVDEPKAQVVIHGLPSGFPRYFRIDGSAATAPVTRYWHRASVHTIEAISPTDNYQDGRWVFDAWSHGAERVFSHAVVVGGGTTEFTATYVFEPYPLCTMTTDPPGLVIRVLGVNRTAPFTIALRPDDKHYVSVASPQVGNLGGTDYIFSSWSDGGDQAHWFLMPPTPTVLTATFETVVHDGIILQALPSRLQIDVDGTPRTTPMFVPLSAGTDHTLLARSGQVLSNLRYDFALWQDGSTDSLRSFTQPTGHVSFTATFDQAGFSRVTLQTVPPGIPLYVDTQPVTTPVTYLWPIGQNHFLFADGSVTIGLSKYSFIGWSHGRPPGHNYSTPPTDVVLTATYNTRHSLVMVADPVGTVLPGDAFVFQDVPLEIRAIPDPKYYFREWVGAGLGAYSGTDNPATIVPAGPITEVAHFGLVSYDFALSLSSEDPAVHTGSPLGFGEVYLWFVCGTGQGFSMLDARGTGSMEVFGFAPEPGIFNLGSGTDVRILVDACPDTTMLLGRFFVSDPGGGTLCLGPSAETGRFEAVDCDAGFESRYPWPDDMRVKGVSTGFEPFCVSGRACGQEGGPVPVRLSSFEAVERDGGVDVTWTTSFEARHEGFRVYRSSDADSRPRALHEGLLDGESPYLFRDTDVVPDMRYWYLLGAFDYGGAETRYGPIAITTSPARPLQFGFAAVHPNPFVERAVLQFTLTKPGRAHVDAFDVAGRLVGRVVDGVYPAGDHSAAWDGRDDRGRRLAAGIYFLRLKTDADSQTRRVVMLGTR